MNALRIVGGCLLLSSLVGCAVPRATGSRGVAFGMASGAESSGRPFTMLRFTPAGPDAAVTGSAVARHPSGDVVVAGFFVDTANVGLGPASLGGSAAFVGRYAPSGAPRWVRWVRTNAVAPRVAVNAQGDVFFVGETQHAPRPFGEPDPAACTDRPTCKLGPTLHALSDSGEVRWSRALPATDARERMWPEMIASGGNGDVTIGGRFGQARDMFVARYGRENGERRWFTRGRGATITSLAVGPSGDVFVGGRAFANVHFDDQVVAPNGIESGFLASFGDKDGVGRWARLLGPHPHGSLAFAMAPDANGDLVVVNKQVNVRDASRLETVAASDGATKMARPLPSQKGELVSAAIDRASDGSTIVALTRNAMLTASGNVPVTVVAGFDSTLNVAWQRELRPVAAGRQPASQVETASLAAISGTEAVVAGSFTGRVELGGNLTEAPWAHEKRRCPSFDDEDDDCTHDWAARAMFVARIKR